MGLLNNKKHNDTTIAELEDYYANQNRNSNARAWVMAILSLLFTIGLVVGLFFAGRWIWSSLFESDSNSASDTTNGIVISNGSTDSDTSDNDSSSIGVVTDEAATITLPSSDSSSNSNQANEEETTFGSVAASSTDANNDTIAAAGADENDSVNEQNILPRTGSEHFVGFTLLIGAVAYFVARRWALSQ